MPEHVLTVTEKTFDAEVLASGGPPVLVVFLAAWCGPCIALSETLDSLAAECIGKLKVCKIDVDESPNLAQSFRIRGIPTLALFKGDNLLATKSGLLDMSRLRAFIGSHL